MRRLIWIFAQCTCQRVRSLTLRLKYLIVKMVAHVLKVIKALHYNFFIIPLPIWSNLRPDAFFLKQNLLRQTLNLQSILCFTFFTFSNFKFIRYFQAWKTNLSGAIAKGINDGRQQTSTFKYVWKQLDYSYYWSIQTLVKAHVSPESLDNSETAQMIFELRWNSPPSKYRT